MVQQNGHGHRAPFINLLLLTLSTAGLICTGGTTLESPSRNVWMELGWQSFWMTWLPLHMKGISSPDIICPRNYQERKNQQLSNLSKSALIAQRGISSPEIFYPGRFRERENQQLANLLSKELIYITIKINSFLKNTCLNYKLRDL